MNDSESTDWYRGKQLRVRWSGGTDTTSAFVTFSNYESMPSLTRPGFGESFFAKRGISAVHFIAASNHWWQTPELHEALNEVGSRLMALGVERRIGYGSSMGGYGALLCAKPLQMQSVLAVSPQYSIYADKVPFESRWRGEAERYPPCFDNVQPASGCRSIVVYDPRYHLDRLHVDLIAPDLRLELPFSGHPSTRMLQQTGALSEAALHLLTDPSKIEDAVANAYERRRQSPVYLQNLAATCKERNHPMLAAVASVVAADGAPRNPTLLLLAYDALVATGRREEAQPYLQRAESFALEELERRGASPNAHWRLRGIYMRLRDLTRAVEHAALAVELLDAPRPSWSKHLEGLRAKRRRR